MGLQPSFAGVTEGRGPVTVRPDEMWLDMETS